MRYGLDRDDAIGAGSLASRVSCGPPTRRINASARVRCSATRRGDPKANNTWIKVTEANGRIAGSSGQCREVFLRHIDAEDARAALYFPEKTGYIPC